MRPSWKLCSLPSNSTAFLTNSPSSPRALFLKRDVCFDRGCAKGTESKPRGHLQQEGTADSSCSGPGLWAPLVGVLAERVSLHKRKVAPECPKQRPPASPEGHCEMLLKRLYSVFSETPSLTGNTPKPLCCLPGCLVLEPGLFTDVIEFPAGRQR